MRSLFLLFVALLLSGKVGVLAQGHTISGKVISAEDNAPLIGVSVVEVGTTNGVITDVDGNYQIQISADERVLRFSFIGMKTVETKLKPNQSKLDVRMEPDAIMTDEVVVVAYGTRKKGTIAGSVSVVKSDKLENVPVASFDQALQGQATGLQVLSNSGEPSAAATFQIRGVNSINAGTAPLFILDGIAVSSSDFSAINPGDIESISVLKDASSTSIYGARAANGVIVITTKRGKMGQKGNITARTQWGISRLAYGHWDQMNTKERLDYEEEIGLRIPGEYNRAYLEQTNINWRDVVFNNNAPFSNYEVQASSASENFNYFVSGNIYRQEGISLGSDFKRYSVRANVEGKVTNWFKLGSNSSVGYEDIKQAESGSYTTVTPISASRFMLPYWNPYRKDGSYTSVGDGSWTGTNVNPLEWLYNNPRNENKFKVLTMVFGEIMPIEGLRIRTQGGLDMTEYRVNASSTPSYMPNLGSGSVARSFSRAYNLTWTNTANYRFNLDDIHDFNFLLGEESVKNHAEAFSASSRGQSNDKLLNLSAGPLANSPSDSQSGSTYLSFFGRGEYNYKSRYYADLSLRRDGSSKFGKNSRWANFWSFGLMWNARQESFLQNLDWLTNAQVSFSMGTSGNSSIPAYDHLNLISSGAQYDGMPGLAPSSRGNENLTWEKLFTTNLALKAGFFNRVNASVEFYNKRTSDMLMEVPISYVNGAGMKWDNIGVRVTRGVEIDLNVDLIANRNFIWNVFANVSYNRNEIKELYNGKDEYDLGDTNLYLKVGHSYGEFFVTRYAGVNAATGDPLWLTKDGEITTEFSEDDRVFLDGKSYIAPWQGGFGTSLSYRGLALNATFSWIGDRYVMNNDRYFDESNGIFTMYNQSKKLLYDRWKKVGDVTEIPRHNTGMYPQFDSHLLENASFLRLKNLTVSYELPKKWLGYTKVIERFKLFAQGQNLFTFTKFTGMDPESTGNMYQAQYPLSRQFSGGIEITF
ncbi:MAG: TonB-dependent receptor [Bacteroidales bacterium]